LTTFLFCLYRCGDLERGCNGFTTDTVSFRMTSRTGGDKMAVFGSCRCRGGSEVMTRIVLSRSSVLLVPWLVQLCSAWLRLCFYSLNHTRYMESSRVHMHHDTNANCYSRAGLFCPLSSYMPSQSRASAYHSPLPYYTSISDIPN